MKADIIKTILFVFLVIYFSACTSVPRFTTKPNPEKTEVTDEKTLDETGKPYKVLAVQEGIASYYADQFHGKKTANGEIFDMNKLSAAHRTYPLGTIVLVTNLKNHKRIRLRINDRGPYVSGRIIDLSYRAAIELDFVKEGTAKVRIEVIKLGDNKYYK